MLLPRFWLHDYCDPGVETPELVERLDLTGTEVERWFTHGVGSPDRFVVGKVLSAEKHPDADRLTVCSVDVGEGEPAQIVCGAPNVAAGQTVPVARPGAVMPDGTELGAAKLRGVESQGMILAEDELGIGNQHDGIIVLDDGPAPGTPLSDVLPIATDVLELAITPNRPDCLAVYGMAREVHAAFGVPLAPPPWADDPGSDGEIDGGVIDVVVEDRDLCPRFTARVFEDVKIGPSPEWLKARLTAAGQRPINNVVDITNYVMLLTGQPLHAFDLDRVAGGRLVVRRAKPGEKLTTLDDVERELGEDMLVILDEDGPTSLAGIMGGERSEVSESSTRVLMEAATWNGPNIHRTSQRLALRSEASGRFEKGVSPESGMEAQAVAAQLILDLAGATLRPGTIDVGGAPPPPEPIHMRDEKRTRLLGEEISRDRSAEILTALDFDVADAGDGLDARPPHFRRRDVTREADLIEEVARIDGLEKLPSTLPETRSAPGAELRPAGLSEYQRLRRRTQDALVARGLTEIIGWAFTDPGFAEPLRLAADDPHRDVVELANPMSSDLSVLRTMLLPDLLNAAQHNAARGAERIHLFQLGKTYRKRDEPHDPSGRGTVSPVDERERVAALLVGPARPPTWREPAPPGADFYAAKGVLAAVLDELRVEWTLEPATKSWLHPGRAADIVVAGARAGYIGELHPLVAQAFDLDGGAAFGFGMDPVWEQVRGKVTEYEDVTSFPALRQDLAVIVGEDVPASRVVEVVRGAGAPELESVEVFDVYRGPQIGEGRVSLALRLSFRAPDRTLTDEEVAARREAITAALAGELGGELRA
jgi:phenylalanyl-tRNA synthetase beta chain